MSSTLIAAAGIVLIVPLLLALAKAGHHKDIAAIDFTKPVMMTSSWGNIGLFHKLTKQPEIQLVEELHRLNQY